MDIKTRRAIVYDLSKSYQKARKKQKGKILDQVIHLCGYDRDHAIRLFYQCAITSKKVFLEDREGASSQ